MKSRHLGRQAAVIGIRTVLEWESMRDFAIFLPFCTSIMSSFYLKTGKNKHGKNVKLLHKPQL